MISVLHFTLLLRRKTFASASLLLPVTAFLFGFLVVQNTFLHSQRPAQFDLRFKN